MKRTAILSVLLATVILTALVLFGMSCHAQTVQQSKATINLPAPEFDSRMTVEQAIQARRSVRSFTNDPLTLSQVSNLLWAAQGITDPATGHRAAPSAMAKYPLEVYLVAANVTGLPAGVYHYIPTGHKLVLVKTGDERANLTGQGSIKQAPATMAITAVYSRFGERASGNLAQVWSALETGHAAENVCLETVSLGLATVTVAGFDPAQVAKTLNLSKDETPIYLLPIGKER